MKKLMSILIVSMICFGTSVNVLAQNAEQEQQEQEQQEEQEQIASTPFEETEEDEEEIQEVGFHQIIKEKFIEGDWRFMTAVVMCLIFGLAVAIERIIVLNLSSTNIKVFLNKIEQALEKKDVEGAKEICKSTRGPIASIFMQGLLRLSEGIEMVEKSIVGYGSVQLGKLEKGLVWISLFISLAPMLGFLGTVVGMIGAFDAIAAAGDVSPNLVAGGIKVALITTVGGLIVAIILQLFYNYCVFKVDAIVNHMENASITFVDMLVKNEVTKK